MPPKQPKNKSNLINLIKNRIIQKRRQFFLGLVAFVILSTLIVNNLPLIPVKSSVKLDRSKSNQKEVKKFPQEYITKEGDYLWQIAEEFYGSGFNAYDIAQVNNITEPNNIPPGTKIILPLVTPRQPTKGEISANQTEKVTNQDQFYLVQLGDSLSSIALKVYGDLNAWPIIAKENNLQNPEQIEVGMVLKIPLK